MNECRKRQKVVTASSAEEEDSREVVSLAVNVQCRLQFANK